MKDVKLIVDPQQNIIGYAFGDVQVLVPVDSCMPVLWLV